MLAFFWVMIFTCILMSVSIYLMLRFHPWHQIPPIPPITIGFLLLLALCSIISGSIISIFVVHHALNPIHELSTAMQKVARGDYSISLNTRNHKGEILCLYEDFNQMVRELNSTEPPMPINSPMLYIIFQIGATTAIAAVPSGP